MINQINFYDDEESGDFFIRTNCKLASFQTELNKYKEREDVIKDGAHYDDFFDIIKEKGYFIDVINKETSDIRVYF